ncbi:TIGR03089 family protein [Cellulomonas fimi]|uniref:TIGR03089 family protein n=1 Tax=Cellulomonas fimi (strain ATCC 484 / DSM 20113 / JCM 1341 / CCUG 24087 / LMG 16345 / NBRC 15513 / NCIMB 8980 / NCTC 7547 / NRS-133) TaxID=590998 RepID=F4H4E2_CELFA|nr:hypothetical protein Celf_2492 [Cellulomonas fimi ATCC 484]NNH09237.1 TIGR03089 family protein [Cellulomonas fimi]VEH33680.1 Uncharacterised protein [Cellulomonas fimi]
MKTACRAYSEPVPATTIADLTALLTREPGRPRITWYGDDGERVELSGAVLDNWVSKTTNLLVEELDAGPGTVVLLDLPGHWRTVLWALAAWRCGATVGTGEAPAADVVVTDRPGRHDARRAAVVALALPALARRVDDLPAGALDGAASVMTYGDALGWVPAVEPQRAALLADGAPVTHGDLLAHAVGSADVPERSRVLTAAAGAAQTVVTTLGVLACDGSVVLTSSGAAGRLRQDADARERLVGTERVDLDRLEPGLPTA